MPKVLHLACLKQRNFRLTHRAAKVCIGGMDAHFIRINRNARLSRLSIELER